MGKIRKDVKYKKILEMKSHAPYTEGKYPTKEEFYLALSNGQVAGDYDKKIVIFAQNPHFHYQFSSVD